MKHSAVWAELKLPESIDVNHILNLHADAEVQKKNTFLLFTFKHFLPSIFSHFISSTLDFLQGSTKVWSHTGFPLWHPDNREPVRLIHLKRVFDAFTSRHIQHCQCFAADSRATDKKNNKFAQNLHFVRDVAVGMILKMLTKQCSVYNKQQNHQKGETNLF